MINTLGIIWLVGWAVLAVASTVASLHKKARGTLTEDDVLDMGFRPVIAAAWPLLVVSLVLTAITLFAVHVWEARVND